jgi:hypothetical protein
MEVEGGRIERLSRNETKFEVPEVGGTTMTCLRNADDYRGKPDQEQEAATAVPALEIGQLMPRAAEASRNFANDRLQEMLATMTPEAHKDLRIVVVASNAALGELATKDGSTPKPRQRCVDTAQEIITGLREAMATENLDPSQLLNRGEDGQEPHPSVLKDIEDMKVSDRTGEYFDLLKQQAEQTGENMWVLYEKDGMKEVREEMGVEGPQDINDRMKRYLTRASKVARWYHGREEDPMRLLVITVVPQDIMGPYVNISSGLPAEGYEIPRTENLAGFNLVTDAEGKSELHIGKRTLPAQLG